MKPVLSVVEVTKIACEILAYLFEHPKSQDTVEGILEWWLLEQRINYQIKRVKEALSELTTKDLVVERRGRNSLIHYQINHRKYREIQAFLNHTHI